MAQNKAQSLLYSAALLIGNNNPLYSLLAYLAQQSSDAVIEPLPNVIFVDAAATNSAEDGSIANPYKTIQAAVTASMTSAPTACTIVVAPGSYPEDLLIPATRQYLTIMGFDPNSTQLQGSGTAATPTILFQPNGVSAFTLRGMTVTANAGARAISIQGESNPNNFTGGVYLYDVVLRNTQADMARFRSCGHVYLNNVRSTGGIIDIETCGNSRITDCDVATINCIYDPAGAIPSVGKGTYELISTLVDIEMTLTGQPSVLVDSESRVAVIGDGGITASGGTSVSLRFYGQQGTAAAAGAFNIALPDTAGGTPVMDLKNGRFYASVAISCAAGTQPVDARGAFFYNPITSYSTSGAGTVETDMRGAQWVSLNIAVGDTLDRDEITVASQAYAAGATVVNITPAFPAGATYVVTPGLTAPLAAAADMPWITAQAVNAFTVNSTGGATASMLLRRTAQP